MNPPLLRRPCVALFLVALSLVAAAEPTTGPSPGSGSDLKLWYQFPARIWEEALPVGNGRIGAMVYGGVQREHIQLSEETIWSPVPRQPGLADPAFREEQRRRQDLLFAGRYREAQDFKFEPTDAERKALGIGHEAMGGASQDAGKEKSRLIRNLESGKPQTLVYYGTSLSGGHWTKQTTEVLKARYGNLITVHNRAKGGMDSKWGRENAGERVVPLKPDTVTIEFSMNDAISSRRITVDAARDNLLAMIDTIRRDNPNVEIILLTMNPIGGEAECRPENHSHYRGGLPNYYQMVRDVAASHGLRLIDLHEVWNDWRKKNPEGFTTLVPDGVHPNEEGCREVILPGFLRGLGLAKSDGAREG